MMRVLRRLPVGAGMAIVIGGLTAIPTGAEAQAPGYFSVPSTPSSLLHRVDWIPPWKSIQQRNRERRERVIRQQKQQYRQQRARSSTYRTLCVRTCDGYYFPISFKATRSKFKTDSISCRQQCSGDARLFVHRNPGQEVNGAVDLKGNRYVDLTNAFRYRKELVQGCECKPAPWTAAAEAARETLDATQSAAGN